MHVISAPKDEHQLNRWEYAYGSGEQGAYGIPGGPTEQLGPYFPNYTRRGSMRIALPCRQWTRMNQMVGSIRQALDTI